MCNLQAMILKSTDYTYTTYDSQAILLQATPKPTEPTYYTYTTYNTLHQQIIKFLSICSTYISHFYLRL